MKKFGFEIPEEIYEFMTAELRPLAEGEVLGVVACWNGSLKQRARLKDHYAKKEEAKVSKDMKDVDLESVFNPFIPGITDDDIIREGQARDYMEKYGPKLDPKAPVKEGPDLEDPENNPFIPTGE